MSDSEWTEPEVHYTVWQWLFFALLIVGLYFEIRYMWTWCTWFTHCPK